MHTMRRMALVLTFCWVLPVHAQAPTDCAKAESTADRRACAKAGYDKADQRLNEVYKQLRERLDADGKTRLRDAQRAWIAYRDAECAWAADQMRGGTEAAVIEAGCRADQTSVRADELESYLESYSK
ncbi:MAG: lysozyme inhibitor LprI family protein [Gammaproteobacteria bacterium]